MTRNRIGKREKKPCSKKPAKKLPGKRKKNICKNKKNCEFHKREAPLSDFILLPPNFQVHTY